MIHRYFQTMMGAVTGAVLLLVIAPASARADAPEAVVTAFHEDLIAVMKASDSLGVSGRYNKFLAYLDRYFHMPLMAAFVSGARWSKASQDERVDLVRAARRMSAGELAVLFSGYGGERFETAGNQPIKDGTVLIRTELKRSEGGDVDVTYRLRKFGEQWRIIDVLLDGTISQLVKRKDEYRRTLEDGGIPALTALLNAKADEILASDGDKGNTAK
jgi:phospholipid transport system substrate-binding protein